MMMICSNMEKFNRSLHLSRDSEFAVSHRIFETPHKIIPLVFFLFFFVRKKENFLAFFSFFDSAISRLKFPNFLGIHAMIIIMYGKINKNVSYIGQKSGHEL